VFGLKLGLFFALSLGAAAPASAGWWTQQAVDCTKAFDVYAERILINQSDPRLTQFRLLMIDARTGQWAGGLCGPTCAVNSVQIALKAQGQKALKDPDKWVKYATDLASQMEGADARFGIVKSTHLARVVQDVLSKNEVDARVFHKSVSALNGGPVSRKLGFDDLSKLGGNKMGIISASFYREANGTMRAEDGHFMIVLGFDPVRGVLKVVDPNSPHRSYDLTASVITLKQGAQTLALSGPELDAYSKGRKTLTVLESLTTIELAETEAQKAARLKAGASPEPRGAAPGSHLEP
jgi:hypothetical protein